MKSLPPSINFGELLIRINKGNITAGCLHYSSFDYFGINLDHYSFTPQVNIDCSCH